MKSSLVYPARVLNRICDRSSSTNLCFAFFFCCLLFFGAIKSTKCDKSDSERRNLRSTIENRLCADENGD